MMKILCKILVLGIAICSGAPMIVSAATKLSVPFGGTATSSFSYGLIGSPGGTAYLRNFATSSLGLLTSNVNEGSNLYYTLNRWATAMAGTTTNALAEGSNNLYWTQSRFDTAFALKSTANLSESGNLYYTDARVDTRVDASSTIPHIGGNAFGDMLQWTGSVWATTSTSTLNITAVAVPAGSAKEIQYNNYGIFGSSSFFTYATTSRTLTTTAINASSLIALSGDMQVEGVNNGYFGSESHDISGNGGYAWLYGGPGSGTNKAGGNVVISAGQPTGIGAKGLIYMCDVTLSIAAGNCIRNDVSAIASTNKDITWSNNSGTPALLEIGQTWTGLQQYAGASTTIASVYGPAYFGATATSTFSNAGVLTLVTPLAVGSGGTGVGTQTTHGVIIGEGTAAESATSAGNAGEVLRSNGASADPAFAEYRAGTLTTFCTGTMPSAAASEFMPGFGGVSTACASLGTTATAGMTVSSSTVKYLRVKCGAAFKNSSGGITTVLKGGVSTGITCTVGTGTTCSDTTHTAAVADGDILTMSITTVSPSETGANCVASLDEWKP